MGEPLFVVSDSLRVEPDDAQALVVEVVDRSLHPLWAGAIWVFASGGPGVRIR